MLLELCEISQVGIGEESIKLLSPLSKGFVTSRYFAAKPIVLLIISSVGVSVLVGGSVGGATVSTVAVSGGGGGTVGS